MKVVQVVGARPQFIKVGPVSEALRRHGVADIMIHTGQHYDKNMSDLFFTELGLREPHVNLGIGSGTHGAQTGAMLTGIEKVLIDEKPNWVVVYGDTNSTAAAALAASKLHIPIAHVEAGLRSFNRRMPEEINRIVTDVLSGALFTPTETASRNLVNEGICKEAIHLVGDVMYDAALIYTERAATFTQRYRAAGLITDSYILATVHRAENTDSEERLATIVGALRNVALNTRVVWPVHPRTRKLLDSRGIPTGDICIIDPVGYLEMLALEKNACVIVTDSGGVQKEAFFQQVPCVTLRDETEWTELIELGWNTLCPPRSVDEICATVLSARGSVGRAAHPYGNGSAASAIVDVLVKSL